MRARALALMLGSLACAPNEAPSAEPESSLPSAKPHVDESVWWDGDWSYADFRRAWDGRGREWLRAHAGARWTGRGYDADADVVASVDAQSLYYAAYATEIGVHASAVCGDAELTRELAALYVWSLGRTTTLGAMRREGKQTEVSTALLEGRGSDATRTFAWREKTSVGTRLRECALCNAQFWFPAAVLSRHLATRGASTWSDDEKDFVALVWPLVVEEHLIRLLYETQWDHWGQRDLAGPLVPMWERVLEGSASSDKRYQRALLDRDLWLLATSGEVLAAHAIEPTRLPLLPDQRERLERAREVGLRRLRASMRVEEHVDFEGRPVESALYFSGQLADHPDYAHAGSVAAQRPSQAAPRPEGSWDISHAARLPVVLRSLHETRSNERTFPTRRDLDLLANQFSFAVFNGDFERPGFNNYLDGSDGWFRLDAKGGAVAPSHMCDSSAPARQCLASGGVRGWALLASGHPSVRKVFQALLDLATTDDPKRVEHRRRILQYADEEHRRPSAEGETYPTVLLWILGAGAELLRDCGTSVRVR